MAHTDPRDPRLMRILLVLVAVVVATLVAALVLAGDDTSGTVVGKSFRSGYMNCVVGNPFTAGDTCQEYDACWQLSLRSDRGDTTHVCVPRELWRGVDVGEFYSGPTVRR